MRRLAGKHWATIGIVALVVLNVVLIVPLVRHQSAAPSKAHASQSPPPANGSTSGESASPLPSNSASNSASSSPGALQTDQPRRLLAANSDRIAWRADPAGCGGNSKVEVTTDGGKTWRRTDTGLTSVVRLKATGGASVFAIGADKNCNPVYASADAPDASWQRDESLLQSTWFRTPNNLGMVHDPQGQTSNPCGKHGLVDLAGLGTSQAIVLCGKGRLRVRNGGQGWHTALKTSGVVALNADDNRFVMAELRPTCDGWLIQQLTLRGDELSNGKRHCASSSSSDPNLVAVGIRSRTTWLWSGDIATAKP